MSKNRKTKPPRSRFAETKDGRLLNRSPVGYLYMLIPLLFLIVFLL